MKGSGGELQRTVLRPFSLYLSAASAYLIFSEKNKANFHQAENPSFVFISTKFLMPITYNEQLDESHGAA